MMRRVSILIVASLAACNRAPTPSPMKGAWESHVAFTSGAFAPMKDLRFLYVFNAGGTMTESSNYDGAPPVPPAYGVWKEVSANKFQSKYIFYMTKPPSRFDELVGGQGWLPTGHGVITEDITLGADGNSWQSKIHWDAFDMDGKPVMGGGDGTTTGKRISF
jgi:hypothetical protein